MENFKELLTMCTRCKILILRQLPSEVCILKGEWTDLEKQTSQMCSSKMFPDQFQAIPKCFCIDRDCFFNVLFHPLFGCLVLLWWSHVGGMKQYYIYYQVCLCLICAPIGHVYGVFSSLFQQKFQRHCNKIFPVFRVSTLMHPIWDSGTVSLLVQVCKKGKIKAWL